MFGLKTKATVPEQVRMILQTMLILMTRTRRKRTTKTTRVRRKKRVMAKNNFSCQGRVMSKRGMLRNKKKVRRKKRIINTVQHEKAPVLHSSLLGTTKLQLLKITPKEAIQTLSASLAHWTL